MKIIPLTICIALVGGVAAPCTLAQPAIHDVPRDHWAYEDVLHLQYAGVFEGDLEGRFNGDKPLTRYELAAAFKRTFPVCRLGPPPNPSHPTPTIAPEIRHTARQAEYPDVPQNHWTYSAIETLSSGGILVGYPDGRFRGDSPVMRYEIAVMLARSPSCILSPATSEVRLQYDSQPLSKSDFTDVPPNHWAHDAALRLAQIGIIKGDLQGRFRGAEPLTRYEFAAVLRRHADSLSNALSSR